MKLRAAYLTDCRARDVYPVSDRALALALVKRGVPRRERKGRAEYAVARPTVAKVSTRDAGAYVPAAKAPAPYVPMQHSEEVLAILRGDIP